MYNTVSMLHYTILYAHRFETLTPIQEALSRGGVDLDLKDEFGVTALHLAVLCGNFGAVRLLVSSGADINIHGGNYSTTPLITAVRHNYSDITKYLLLCGADVNAVDVFGNTALHEAVIGGEEFESIIHMLLAQGADTSIRNAAGQTVNDMARRVSDDMVHILKKSSV